MTSDIHIWRCDTRSYAPSRSAVSSLSLTERRRAAQITRPDVRRDFLAAHTALRQILAGWTGVAASELRFDTHCAYCGDSLHGRPVLVNDLAVPLPSFNISRRDGVVLIAVTDACAVGVDVEAVEPGSKWDLIRDRLFTAAEESRLSGRGPEAAGAAAALWARKEAVSKAVGLGLALPGEHLTVGGQPAGGWVQVRLADGAHEALPASMPIAVRDLPIFPGYAAAVSVVGEAENLSLVLHDL